MPTAAYTPLAEVTLGSSASSVTFSSISQAYRDLILVVTGTGSMDKNAITRFNSDSGSNYSEVYAYGTGSSSGSGIISTTYISQLGIKTDVSVNTMQIMDYSATDKHKTVLIRTGSAGSETKMAASRWANTSAITTISLALESSQTWSSGTSFELFGVAA